MRSLPKLAAAMDGNKILVEMPSLLAAVELHVKRYKPRSHTMSTVSIRTLSPEDSLINLTSLLHRAYERLGAMGLQYTAVNQTPDVTANRIKGGVCFVAETTGAIVGTILVKPTCTESECDYFTHPGVATVHQFAVDPAVQGRGIGRALLAHSEAWASEKGFRELAMDTAEQAAHLIRFYSDLGYKHVDFVKWSDKVYRSVVLSKVLQ